MGSSPMSHRVIWRNRIQNQLHTATFIILERGGDTEPLSHAVREIDRQLKSDPMRVGESREGNERLLIIHPLSVLFEVFEEEQIVLIYEAILYPRRKL
jgi:hypothetical protein